MCKSIRFYISMPPLYLGQIKQMDVEDLPELHLKTTLIV